MANPASLSTVYLHHAEDAFVGCGVLETKYENLVMMVSLQLLRVDCTWSPQGPWMEYMYTG